MRRTLAVTLVGISMSLGLVSEALASATAEPNVTVSSTRVKLNEFLTVTVRNCKGGGNDTVGDYTAKIWFEHTPPGGSSFTESRDPDESDGVAEVPQGYGTPGVWKLKVWCTHTWSTGSGQPWPDEEFTIEVYKEGATSTPTLTDAERKRCHKIKNKKRRKRCLRRARAD